MGKLNIQCFTCIHNEVCKMSGQYKSAIKSLEDVSFGCDEQGVAKIRETAWLDMELKCKHHISVNA